MTSRAVGFILPWLALSIAPSGAGAAPLEKPRPVTADEKATIIARVGNQFPDEQSTLWRWPLVRDGVAYCGFLNAKNRSGVYTGFRIFYVALIREENKPLGVARDFLAEGGDDPMEFGNFITTNLCKASGYSLTDVPSE